MYFYLEVGIGIKTTVVYSNSNSSYVYTSITDKDQDVLNRLHDCPYKFRLFKGSMIQELNLNLN